MASLTLGACQTVRSFGTVPSSLLLARCRRHAHAPARPGKTLHARVAELVKQSPARLARVAAIVSAGKGGCLVGANGVMFTSVPSAATREALAGGPSAALVAAGGAAVPPSASAATTKPKRKGKK